MKRRPFLLLAKSVVSADKPSKMSLSLGYDNDDKEHLNSGHADHPEWILLCDDCEDGWHASCLRPSLMVIPEGDW